MARAPIDLAGRVQASTLPLRYKKLIVGMLSKDRLGLELWTCTERLQVVVGALCMRRKTSSSDSLGRKLGRCERAHYRTVQRLIDELADERGVGLLKKVEHENTWVGPPGNRKFRRSATYELRPEKLQRAQSEAEWVEQKAEARFRAQRASSASYASHRPPASEASSPVSSLVPPDLPPVLPRPAQPAVSSQPPPAAAVRAKSPPGEEEAIPQGKHMNLNSRAGGKLIAKIRELVEGVTGYVGLDGLRIELQPGQDGYQAPLSKSRALFQACWALGIPYWSAKAYAESCGWKFEETEEREE